MTIFKEILPYYVGSGVKVLVYEKYIEPLVGVKRGVPIVGGDKIDVICSNEIKLLCRPLSDYKDIVGEAMNELNIDLEDQIQLSNWANRELSQHNVSFGIVKICIDNHIWIGTPEDFEKYCEKI